MTITTFSWGTSCIGPAHLKNNLPNQDAWCIDHIQSVPCTVYIVADGLGSYANSHIGSAAVKDAVIQSIDAQHTLDPGGVLGNPELLCSRIQWFWNKLLNEQNIPIETAYTTCLLLVEFEKDLLFVQVGDGLLLGINLATHSPIFKTPNTDFFSNQTHCLEETFTPHNWHITSIRKPATFAVMLCTDGIADDLKSTDKTAYLLNLLAVSKTLTQEECAKMMLDELKNWPTPDHHDDKTIVFVGRWHDEEKR